MKCNPSQTRMRVKKIYNQLKGGPLLEARNKSRFDKNGICSLKKEYMYTVE